MSMNDQSKVTPIPKINWHFPGQSLRISSSYFREEKNAPKYLLSQKLPATGSRLFEFIMGNIFKIFVFVMP